jgi:hypothetical protein
MPRCNKGHDRWCRAMTSLEHSPVASLMKTRMSSLRTRIPKLRDSYKHKSPGRSAEAFATKPAYLPPHRCTVPQPLLRPALCPGTQRFAT